MGSHSGHNHAGHSHGVRGAGPDRARQRRALWISLVANAGFMVAEAVGGIVFHSLALLADSAHMLSDVAGLAIALVAQSLMDRPATESHSYGWQRAEVLGAQVNGLALLAVSGWVVVEAIGRIGSPAEVSGLGVLVVAGLGLAVNLGSAVLLARAQGDSLNMRGAFIHMAADAAGSVGAMAAGAAALLWAAGWVDPAISLAISALVVWSAWGLLKDTTRILLEGAPAGLDATEVSSALLAGDGVSAVHHLHLWELASATPALSAHVVLADADSLHDAQVAGDALKTMLADRFGIEHATLELECHPCEPHPHELARTRAGADNGHDHGHDEHDHQGEHHGHEH